VEQHLTAAQPALGHRCGQGVGRLVVELTEQRCLSEHCGIHFGPPRTFDHGCERGIDLARHRAVHTRLPQNRSPSGVGTAT
jgi:hypothetical protein